MVGLPYTSLACANCRQRKIKCDFGKPECGRCIKKGISCLGYDKDRNFLYHNVVSRCTPKGETRRPIRQLIGHIKPLGLPPVFNMAPEVRTQLFSTFMHTFFSRNTKTNSKDDTLYFLMAHFPILAGESELIDRSVIALVSAVLAKKANDSLLTRQGLEIYNSALDVMSCSLRRKAPPTSNMLYATILFHTYETMYDNADALRKCFLHVQGASALIKHHDFKRDDTRALTEAMLNRQKWAASFFVLNTNFESTADWECLALKQDDSPMDELFRFIAQYALIQRHFLDLVGQDKSIQQQSCETLLQRCSELQGRLQTVWLCGTGCALDGKPSPLSDNQIQHDPRLWPLDPELTPYTFQNLNTAKTYLLFWVTSLATHHLVYRAEKLLYGSSDPANILLYAGEICRSMAYCMRPETQVHAGHAVLFAISQASKCYIDCGERDRFEWCQGIYKYINRRGFDIASCVSQSDWQLWIEARQQSSDHSCT